MNVSIENKIYPIKENEREVSIKKEINGLIKWRKGERVFASKSYYSDGFNIRPVNELGPTTVCVPEDYLDFN